jgi:putative tryptophan/tyrosine transport system substrate-binding protein
MKRREFITLLAGAATWPLAAHAQQSGSKHRLGLLLALAENDPQAREYVAAFVQSLRERGWLEGNTSRSTIGGLVWIPSAFVVLGSN